MLHRFLLSSFNWNTRYLFFWIGGERRRQQEESEEDPFLGEEEKQFIRKVSLWFNKSPNWKCYLHSFSFSSLLFLFLLCPSFSYSEQRAKTKTQILYSKSFNCFSSRNFFICAKASLHFLCTRKSIAFDNEMWSFFWRIKGGKTMAEWMEIFTQQFIELNFGLRHLDLNSVYVLLIRLPRNSELLTWKLLCRETQREPWTRQILKWEVKYFR